MELYKKYRPKKLEEMIGQDSIIKSLRSKIKRNKVPHSILFTGPSGCGKTTLARILRRSLKCHKHEFKEVNTADFRGIDTIRQIRQHMNLSPLRGDCKIWLIDECHKLSNDAQNALLKILEDTPNHVYFMLATTDPHKLLKTVINRCSQISVSPLSDTNILTLIENISNLEKIKISSEVSTKIIEVSEGSARKALVLLDLIIDLDDKEDMLKAISDAISEEQGIAVARALFNQRIRWPDMAKILKNIQKEESESIRWIVLGYAKSILLSGSKLSGRAYEVIDIFRDNFYDSKLAGLSACCYEAVIRKN